MAIADDQIAGLKHAYQVLGVPLSASVPFIKRTYRNLVRRWHPDLYPCGSQDYAEATQMTQLINAAYSSIKSAPLRYYIDACPPAHLRDRQTARPTTATASHAPVESILKTGWLEFCIRFVFGAAFGALIGFRFFLFYYEQLDAFIIGTVGAMLVLGVLAARSGDNFWHSLLRRWWIWW
jgi:DnaJ-class molecular chaperone